MMPERIDSVESDIELEGHRDRSLGRKLSPAIVAIDGPAASGKTTVGQRLAEALDYVFFDTGLMYRALTWATLERGLDVRDSESVGALAESLALDIVPANGDDADGGAGTAIVLDGRDVTAFMRTKAVDQNVSAVSAHARVRTALSKRQRAVAREYGAGQREKSGIIMVGRDIGTVVIPDAPIKVYLDASAEERARRRYEELRRRAGGPEDGITLESVLQDIKRRDEHDSHRDIAPLSVAHDAVIMDTTDLTIAQVVTRLLDIVRVRVSQRPIDP